MHDASPVPPVVVPYLPATQSVQLPLAAGVLYLPATHAVQFPTLASPPEPAVQVQLIKAELPTGALEFAGHERHVESFEAPATAEYVPIRQSLHAADPA